MPSLVKLIQEDEGIQKLITNLEQGTAGLLRGLTADTLGAPVDLVNEVLRPVGLASETPVLGSAFIREKTGMPAQEENTASMLGNLLSSLVQPEKLPLALGIFAGPKSKLWNEGKAKLYELGESDPGDKLDPAQLWRATGTGRSPGDKLLRQEIDDSTSAFKIFPEQGEKMKSYRLENAFDHPELYEAYPALRAYRVIFDPSMEGASFNNQSKVLVVGIKPDQETRKWLQKYPGMKAGLIKAQAQKSILHELQHGVQNIEGFDPGSSPDREISKLTETLMEANSGKLPEEDQYNLIKRLAIRRYYKQAGEAEARVTESRAALDSDMRRALYPFEESPYGYDVNPESLYSRHRQPAITNKLDIDKE